MMSEREQICQNQKKNRKITNICAFFPAIFMMAAIYYFSSCTGEESSQSSGLVVQILLKFLEHIPFVELSKEIEWKWALLLEYPVRKAAHMMEYGVLAGCFLFGFYNLFQNKEQKRKNKFVYLFVLSWLATVCYAATDEAHQLLVAGRSGKVTDVMIDAGGAFIMLIVIFFIWNIKKKRGTKYE